MTKLYWMSFDAPKNEKYLWLKIESKDQIIKLDTCLSIIFIEFIKILYYNLIMIIFLIVFICFWIYSSSEIHTFGRVNNKLIKNIMKRIPVYFLNNSLMKKKQIIQRFYIEIFLKRGRKKSINKVLSYIIISILKFLCIYIYII